VIITNIIDCILILNERITGCIHNSGTIQKGQERDNNLSEINKLDEIEKKACHDLKVSNNGIEFKENIKRRKAR